MARNTLIWIFLLVLICCFSTLTINKTPNAMDLTKIKHNRNLLSSWYKYLNSIENSPSIYSTKGQRRNVIMPRICYFSRITKSGIHQKLCLPYNNEEKRKY